MVSRAGHGENSVRGRRAGQLATARAAAVVMGGRAVGWRPGRPERMIPANPTTDAAQQRRDPGGSADRLRVLVAGAGGVLGRLIVGEAARRGHVLRAVVRRARAGLAPPTAELRVIDGLRSGAWAGACDRVDVVISALGAAVDPSPLVGWRSYTRVDAPANIALLREAERAGVRRFVYVSLIDGAQSRRLNYAEGHERVVDALRAGRVAASVLRPTGFFAAMTALIDFARRGLVPVIGDGACRTNPICEHDLAQIALVEAERAEAGVREVPAGGPEVFTRRRIAEMAFEALGRRPRLVHVPGALMAGIGHLTRLVNPRAGHFTLFAAHIMTHECLAPPMGRRRLADAFRAYCDAEAAA